MPEKALIHNFETGEDITVRFNPSEYQIQKNNQFAEMGIPGLGSSLMQFVRGSAQTLTLELFFDTTDSKRDVRRETKQVVNLMKLDKSTHAPPRLVFIWGTLEFPCILESVNQRFTYFGNDGKPLRANLSVTFKEFRWLEDILAKDALESADRTKQHVVKAAETLQQIAAQTYDDPRKWRPIAVANQLLNPLMLKVGQALTIPTLPS
jgi:nucleoid-associated protein YgaU